MGNYAQNAWNKRFRLPTKDQYDAERYVRALWRIRMITNEQLWEQLARVQPGADYVTKADYIEALVNVHDA